MAKLQGSPYIVQLFGCSRQGEFVRLFMNYAQGGEVWTFLIDIFVYVCVCSLVYSSVFSELVQTWFINLFFIALSSSPLIILQLVQWN